jgi:hypothetical protein
MPSFEKKADLFEELRIMVLCDDSTTLLINYRKSQVPYLSLYSPLSTIWSIGTLERLESTLKHNLVNIFTLIQGLHYQSQPLSILRPRKTDCLMDDPIKSPCSFWWEVSINLFLSICLQICCSTWLTSTHASGPVSLSLRGGGRSLRKLQPIPGKLYILLSGFLIGRSEGESTERSLV